MHKLLTLSLAIIFLSAGTLLAQWERTSGGPYGPISSMASKDGKLFATTGEYEFTGGILRSTDLGSSWKFVNNGLTPKDLYKVVTGKNYVFAHSDRDIFRTTDYGDNWEKCDSGLPGANRIGGVMYALGTDLYLYTNSDSKLYYSSNEGDSWESTREGRPFMSVFTSLDSSLIVGTGQEGLYISNDHGITWDSAGLVGKQITALATFNNTIFAGTKYDGIFYSSDKGVNWIQINKGISYKEVLAFAVSGPVLSVIVPYNIYHLKVGDTTWHLKDKQILGSTPKALVAIDTFIFEGNYEGRITKTSNNSPFWIPCDSWLSSWATKIKASIYNLYNGAWRSTNNGDSWVTPYIKHDTTHISSYNIGDIGFIGSTIYGVGFDSVAGVVNGIIATVDNGEHWYNVLRGSITHLFVSNRSLFAVYGNDDSICHSIDEGVSWQTINYQSHPDYEIRDIVVGDKDIYLSIGSGLFFPNPKIVGVFRSTDNGNSWIKTNVSGSNLLVMDSDVFSIYYTGTDRSVLSRASSYGAGTPLSLLPDYTVYQCIVKAGHLFATTNKGVFQSTDKGDTWTDISQELITLIYYLPKTIAANDTFLFVSNSTNSVWRRKLAELGVVVKSSNSLLSQNSLAVYPNPTSQLVKLTTYSLQQGYLSLSIFDELGREVRRVHDGFLDAGEHEFSAELPTGMYYVRMQAVDEVLTRKVTVVR
jgi:photosystem II stability/assembly factor-like uncharacterized protein